MGNGGRITLVCPEAEDWGRDLQKQSSLVQRNMLAQDKPSFKGGADAPGMQLSDLLSPPSTPELSSIMPATADSTEGSDHALSLAIQFLTLEYGFITQRSLLGLIPKSTPLQNPCLRKKNLMWGWAVEEKINSAFHQLGLLGLSKAECQVKTYS